MLDADLKKVIYRLRYRGMKELDIFFSRMIQALKELNKEDQIALGELMQESEDKLYVWLLGQAPRPDRYKKIIEKFLTFY